MALIHSGQTHFSFFSLSSSNEKELFPLQVPACIDYEQIERDVARCTWHLLTGSQRSRRLQHENKHRKKVASLLRKKQVRLANLINLTLEGTSLRYYQGYHDVACIFLHALGGGSNEGGGGEDVMGLQLPAEVLQKMSHFHLQDSCQSSFKSLQQCLQLTLFPLLAKLDTRLHNHLQDCDMEPFFCLSWILTWFSHDIRDTNLVKRIFDAFLVSHPLLVLYVSIAMMVHPINRQILLETDCDFAALHHTLSMLPRNSCKVGWKRSRGGYVSDDDMNGDNVDHANTDVKSINTDVSSNWDASVVSSNRKTLSSSEKQRSLATDTTMGLSSSSSLNNGVTAVGDKAGTLMSDKEKVPFQQLIEMALAYMKHYPPTCLMDLARWYYVEQDDSLHAKVATIGMLQPPPSWAVASVAEADWVWKQRLRQELGMTKTSRKDRRKKKSLNKKIHVSEEPVSDLEYIRRHSRSLAVVAAGCGPVGYIEEKEMRKRKRRKSRLVAVGISAIVVLGMINFFYYQPSEQGDVLQCLENASISTRNDSISSNLTESLSSSDETGTVTTSKNNLSGTTIPLVPAKPDLTSKPETSKPLRQQRRFKMEQNILSSKHRLSLSMTRQWSKTLKKFSHSIIQHVTMWVARIFLLPIKAVQGFWQRLPN